jgi:ElaB/YqjD/DUF883 family membrane-anchored ribosome-binding protein
MFYRRSSLAAIQDNLQGVENELRRLGQDASQRTSRRASALRDQIADIVTPILNEVAELVRTSPRLTAQASRLSDDALKAGTRLSNEAVDRVAREVEQRPFVILALVFGVGILIGLAGRHRFDS